MTIRTATRFRPFCREECVLSLIPGTKLYVKVYHNLLQIFDLETGKVFKEIDTVKEPVKQFLVTLDLEKNWVSVTGFIASGFMRYRISSQGIFWDKGIEKENEQFSFPQFKPERERLSCGSKKAQDVFLIQRRKDLQEFLPFWYFIAQSFPKATLEEDVEKPSLLNDVRKSAIANDWKELSKALTYAFEEGFVSLLFPRIETPSHLGLEHPLIVPKNPWLFLQQSFFVLRSLFLEEQGGTLFILPHLPVELHVGKLVRMELANGNGFISLEWTKHGIRRIFFEAAKNCSYLFKFSEDIRRFKLVVSSVTTVVSSVDVPLEFVAGGSYLLHSFS